jgi:hypothetical protein
MASLTLTAAKNESSTSSHKRRTPFIHRNILGCDMPGL